MSPVPEKKSGSWGVSMRKRRGWCVDVAVEPMMVRFLICSRGVWVPDAGCDPERNEGTVWLSWVRRRDVMITWGTW
jgi:hypothetical protein